MSGRKMVVWFTVVVVVIGLLVYRCFDMAISLDHARSEEQLQRRQIALLRDALGALAPGASRARVEDFARRFEGDRRHVLKRSANQLEIDGIVFIFDSAGVVEVTFGDKGEADAEGGARRGAPGGSGARG